MCRAADETFVISPGARDARDWARRFGDTYLFDWDIERSTAEAVYVWPCQRQTIEGLEQALREDSVEFEVLMRGGRS